jgi:hypothetical protein
MTLPAHPPPLKDESMASWIARLANANGTSVKSLLSAYLRKTYWERADLDMLEQNDTSMLSEISGMQNPLLRKMVLFDFKGNFLLSGKHNRKTWLSSTFMARFCPRCLHEDSIPYYRLLWRLHFVPICLTHGCLIQSVESKCAKRPNGLLVSYPGNCERVFSFASNIHRTLERQEALNTYGFPYSIKECFGTLMLFTLYFSKYLSREKEWNDLRHLYNASPCGFSYLWRTNSNFACIVMEKALAVLEEWSKTRDFILQNRHGLKNICHSLEEAPEYVKMLIRGRGIRR